MDKFGQAIIGIAGGIFGALLLGFTAFETFQFLNDVTENPIVAVIGLVMFEGGFIYWGVVFKKSAEGLGQMAIALLTSLLDFSMVIVAVSMSLGAVDKTVLGDKTASMVVVVAVLINLSAKFGFSLADPEVMQNIIKRAVVGNAIVQTFKAFQTKVESKAPLLADKMAQEWMIDMERQFVQKYSVSETNSLLTDGNGNSFTNGVKQLFGYGVASPSPTGTVVEGETVPAQPKKGRDIPLSEAIKEFETIQEDNAGNVVYTLDELLQKIGKSKEEIKAMATQYNLNSAAKAYGLLSQFGYLPDGMTVGNFDDLFTQVMLDETGNGNGVTHVNGNLAPLQP